MFSVRGGQGLTLFQYSFSLSGCGEQGEMLMVGIVMCVVLIENLRRFLEISLCSTMIVGIDVTADGSMLVWLLELLLFCC